ncbi:WcbI family polysaccharide biosynthesis putative acetyltransferase [Synechococcus sp. BA-124 BA4]|jgi:hypothetical protein|uniref:WcbI family polysaccharide biosynthesis putative acetyltransferase n=1 Tax=Synechococcus sp. BA-124 BA4 TaxID=3110251 RepID=UPI002B1EAEC2|nr:WcbI family polysaccharide biosynthesis putative acetyltransferase [Synechococcus sp. BA-124 BA4]MEA5399457.1 WcbI family polysaccharide biosynthesis putative acetyltransferase [Synechococcus sp. BA-124 BA4]
MAHTPLPAETPRGRAACLDLARECLRRQGLARVAELVWDGVNASEASLEADEQELLRELGLACHQQMLAVVEGDPAQAIALACWGARLFGHLLDQGSPQAEWVAIHHEQFCRYGSIWIHRQLTSCDDDTPALQRQELGATALKMLETLGGYHDPLPDWVPVYREAFLAIPGTSAGAPPWPAADSLITIVGNCQSHPIFLGLERALPSHRFHYCAPVHMATAEDVAELHRVLGDTQVLVMHRVTPGYRDGIGLDGATLQALLPKGAGAVVLPNLHYEGYHPTIGYAHDDRGELPGLASESPLGDYHDFLAMAAAERGLEAEEILALACTPEMEELLQAWHRRSLQELARREQECDLRISPWLEANHNGEGHPMALFHTFNHPSNQVLEKLLEDLLEDLVGRLGQEPGGERPGLGSPVEQLGRQRHAILPWTRQALALPAWAAAEGRRDWENSWTLEEQLGASIAFYRRHRWLVACNRQQEKYGLAERLLALATG